jgi:hypothetical protein
MKKPVGSDPKETSSGALQVHWRVHFETDTSRARIATLGTEAVFGN